MQECRTQPLTWVLIGCFLGCFIWALGFLLRACKKLGLNIARIAIWQAGATAGDDSCDSNVFGAFSATKNVVFVLVFKNVLLPGATILFRVVNKPKPQNVSCPEGGSRGRVYAHRWNLQQPREAPDLRPEGLGGSGVVQSRWAAAVPNGSRWPARRCRWKIERSLLKAGGWVDLGLYVVFGFCGKMPEARSYQAYKLKVIEVARRPISRPAPEEVSWPGP